MRTLTGEGLDPFRHLATEQYLLTQTDRTVLYLWRSNACVVIGRHQNPWLECDLRKLSELGVTFVRRESGGGTVYHDPGNLNYAFISDTDGFSAGQNSALIATAIGRLGIEVEVSERSDLFVAGKKVGGTAFRHTKGRSLHHGTVLVDADLSRLGASLRPVTLPGVSIRGTAIASVRAITANLIDFDPDIEMTGVIEAIRGEDGDSTMHVPKIVGAEAAEWIESHAAHLASDEWRIGKTPGFEIEIDGKRPLSLKIGRGYVTEVSPADHPLAQDLAGRSLLNLNLHALLRQCGEG